MLYYIQHFNQMYQFANSKCFVSDILTHLQLSLTPHRNFDTL